MEITNSELKEKLNNGEKIIVEFWASWCRPCNTLKPIFEKVASSNTTDVQMYTMNIDEGDNKDTARFKYEPMISEVYMNLLNKRIAKDLGNGRERY